MATILLVAGGTALGGAGTALGTLLGAVGAGVGGLIDQMIFFPPPDQEGPRLDSQPWQSATEGSPELFVLGSGIRCTGQLIGLSDLIETRVGYSVGGGCFGGDVDMVEYQYSVHVGIAICEAGTETRGPIQSVQKIWADGTLIWDDNPDVQVVGDDISLDAIYVIVTIHADESDTDNWNVTAELTAPAGGSDLSGFIPGVPVTMSGWSSSTNNTTWTVLSSEDLDSAGTKLVLEWGNERIAQTVSIPPSNWPVDEAAGATVTISQTNPNFNPGLASSFTFYNGDQTVADPVLESVHGSGNVPTYEGTAYVVIEGFQLGQFGNRLPNFTFQVEADTTITVGQSIVTCAARSGLSSSYVDVSGLSASLRGLRLRGPQEMDKPILGLMLAYDLEMQEDAGVLRFFDADSPDEVAVAAADLGAHQHGGTAPRDMLTTDVNNAFGSLIPSELQISFIDPAWDYQDGMRRHRMTIAGNTTVKRVRLPIVLTAQEAQQRARQMLWTTWAQRQRVKLQLPPSYLSVAEGDVLTFTEGGESRRVLVRQVTRGANFLLEIEGVLDADYTHSFPLADIEVETPTTAVDGVSHPPTLILRIIDLAPLNEAHVNLPGFYYVMGMSTDDKPWAGGALWESTDGTNYDGVGWSSVEGKVGYSTDALGGSVDANLWDRVSSVNVHLYAGQTISSATAVQVLNGANMFRLGAEIIQAATVTLETDGTFTLTNLLRGRRGTESAIDSHTSYEGFEVLAPASGVYFHRIPTSAIGTRRWYKAPSAGQPLGNAHDLQHTIFAGCIRTFAPGGVQAFRVPAGNPSAGDVTFEWVRRSRSPVALFGRTAAPLNEPDEAYFIDVLNGSPSGAVVATYGVTDTTWTYTAAMQTTDFGSPQSTVYLNLYQLSTGIGRGKGRAAQG